MVNRLAVGWVSIDYVGVPVTVAAIVTPVEPGGKYSGMDGVAALLPPVAVATTGLVQAVSAASVNRGYQEVTSWSQVSSLLRHGPKSLLFVTSWSEEYPLCNVMIRRISSLFRRGPKSLLFVTSWSQESLLCYVMFQRVSSLLRHGPKSLLFVTSWSQESPLYYVMVPSLFFVTSWFQRSSFCYVMVPRISFLYTSWSQESPLNTHPKF
jgi:hypothetical protein